MATDIERRGTHHGFFCLQSRWSDPLAKLSKNPADWGHWEIHLSGLSHPAELSRAGELTPGVNRPETNISVYPYKHVHAHTQLGSSPRTVPFLI